jgi:hypothetical protein
MNRARARAFEVRLFYTHVLIFAVGTIANFVMNSMTQSVEWVFVIWVVAIGVQAVTLVDGGSVLGAAWEERRLQRYITDGEGDDAAVPDPRNS